MVTDPTMVVLVAAILGGVGVIALLIFLRFTQGGRQTGLLENIERHEREQAAEDREAGEVLRGGPRAGAVAPVGPAPAGAVANGGAQPRGGPSALAQATAQRLAALEERGRQREEHERERQRPRNPILEVYQRQLDRIFDRSEVAGVKLAVSVAKLDNLEMEEEALGNTRDARNRQRRLERRRDTFYSLEDEEAEQELEQLRRYPEHRPERPVEETRRPAEPTRPEAPVQEVPAEPEAAPSEEPVETDDTDAVLAEARRIAGETEAEDEEET